MRIPIIFYHAIFDREKSGEKYAIWIEEFRRQIEYLAAHGFKGLVLDDLYRPGSVKEGEMPVIISFDDGHASDRSLAYPVLSEFGFSATFFVTAGWVGKPGYVSWDDLRSMAQAGMSIQSHSLTHSFMSDLAEEDLKKELLCSKDLLSEKLGSPVDYISLPGGFCSKKVLDMAEKLGYRAVCTSRPGVAGRLDANDFAILDRLLITGKTTAREFEDIVHADRRRLASYRAEYYFKSTIRTVLGSQGYYKIWSMFFKNS